MTNSDAMVTPPCIHYTQCGGCTLQHLPLPAQHVQKTATILHALQQHGVECDDIKSLQGMAPDTRRRTTLHMYRTGKTVVCGYKEARSHRIVSVEMCPILTPVLQKALPFLQPLFAPLLPDKTQMKILLTTPNEHHIDVALMGIKPPQQAALTSLLRACHGWPALSRLTINNELIYQVAPPLLSLEHGITAELPLGGVFLQPSTTGQNALCQAVRAALPTSLKSKTVIDLFCGIGTFSAVAVSLGAQVSAYDSDQNACAAFKQAFMAFNAQVHVRDLFIHPIASKDFKTAHYVLLNPPRAGALNQVMQIAATAVPHVVYVSCAPDTFARDALVLQKAGYRCRSIQPVDQFVHSNHVELVAHFSR